MFAVKLSFKLLARNLLVTLKNFYLQSWFLILHINVCISLHKSYIYKSGIGQILKLELSPLNWKV